MLLNHRVLLVGPVLVGAVLAVMSVARAAPEHFGAIGGSPNATLKEITAENTDPYVFREDRENAKAPPAIPQLDESGKPVKPKPVLPENFNEKCWAASLDLSGIPWHTGLSGAAISRRHIVTAAHWGCLTSSMAFQSRDGEKVVVSFLPVDQADHPDFKPARGSNPEGPACWFDLGHDVAIATTAKPIPESIAVYPLPASCDLALRDELVGRSVVSTSWSDDNHQPEPKGVRLVGVRRIRRLMNESVAFEKDPELPDALYFPAVVGDSGNPLFFLERRSRTLILVSTFTGGGGGSGPYYGSEVIRNKILTYIAASPAPDDRFTTFDLGSEKD